LLTHFYPEVGVQAKNPQHPGKVPDIEGPGHEPIDPVFDQLTGVGIDLEDVFLVLETEGVDKFKKSWDELVETVKGQMEKAAK